MKYATRPLRAVSHPRISPISGSRQMRGEITPAGVIDLDSIFENQRDSVRMICKQVKQYEKTVIEKVRRLGHD